MDTTDTSDRLEANVSARLTNEERALVDAAAARADCDFRSTWLRRAVREKLQREFGDELFESEAFEVSRD